ncbi:MULTISPECIES: DUF6397 family protein [unclassified Streptomyces]|uniref:DUF6397 family protein n=1 Tax=unclassified Streptomyces TaxID=2593676 RepID=UPI0036E77322
MTVTGAVRPQAADTMAVGTAAQELRLKRGEFAIAVHVGLVHVVVQPGSGRPRVCREELDRLRTQGGFPETLRERVRTVGTAEGAVLLGISPDRFTKLARAGCLTPITFYLNRYRAVVWLYLAQELSGFAAREPELLVGRSPAWVRSRLEGGADSRARAWRSRRVERLLSLTEDPWARAAVLAETLDPVQLAEVVDDPYERVHLARIRPEPAFGPTGSATARETAERLMRADEPDEMLWRRVGLITALDTARETRPAPRPGDEPRPRTDAGGGAGQESEAERDAGRESPPVPGPGGSSVSAQDRGPVQGFGSAAVPEAAPAFVPVRDGAPVHDPAPGPRPVPTAAPEAAVGLLARLGLRRRSSRRPRR